MNRNLLAKVGSVVLASALTVSLIPKIGAVNDLKADETWEKSKENTRCGTFWIASPVVPEDKNDYWSGSYVYFGEYEGTPIKFRVLAKETKEYGGKTMFLDSAYNLFNSRFNEPEEDPDNVKTSWLTSYIRRQLNGDLFLDKQGVFTDSEKAAIAASKIASHDLIKGDPNNPAEGTVCNWAYNNVIKSTQLVNDKIFIPDVYELSNTQYGYTVNIESNTRVKGPSTVNDHWLTRSASPGSGTKDIAGIFGGGDHGHIGPVFADSEYAIAPALNIDLSSVLFSSLISGEFNKVESEYKLTIKDDEIKLKVPDGKKAVVDGRKVTVPYELSGKDAQNVTNLSACIIEFGGYPESLLYYEKLNAPVSSSGTVDFTIPSDIDLYDFGKRYKVCLIAEDVNDEKHTDYASEPLVIKNPEVVYDLRNVLPFTNNDYYFMSSVVEARVIGSKVTQWDSEIMSAVLDIDNDGVYDITHIIEGGNGILKKLDTCKLKGSYTIDLDKLAPDLYVSKVTFILSELSVKLDKVNNGTASLSKSKALPGDTITVTAKANTGYKLDKITYTPEGGSAVNITNSKKFTMPNTDVTVKVTFKKAANPTPTAKPTAKPTKKATPKPSTNPAVSLTLDKKTATVECGKTLTLKATLKGSKAKVAWKSSDTKIATVDSNGKITAKMAGTVTVTAAAAGKTAECKLTVLYKDVTNPDDFWYAPTNYLTAKGIVKGYANQTEFRPANNCTRAQMVTFIWRLQGEPEPESKTCKFKDVKETDYFYKACIWGNENHIVEGYKDGTFGPQIVCARKHAVTFLWRLANKPKPESTENKFKDVKKSDYFYQATLWASEKGILAGYSDGTFRPNGDCLRRQMVTFLYKYDKYVNGKG
ncbi:MAG: S-layer homology domain-containing protein [Clostridiales bacterium]|nr:S-layer homology domain-containing protein [Clostridiales bacterium]